MQKEILLMNHLGKTNTPFIFLIDFEGKKPEVWTLDENNNIKYNFNGFTNYKYGKKIDKPFYFDKFPIDLDEYKKKFDAVQHQIHSGNSYLINLCVDTPIKTNLTFENIFENVKSKYSFWYPEKFICFSPETFIQIKNNKIFSYPMKGTINALINNAADILMNNVKEKSEHATIVDLIRNDLSMVAKNIHVTKYRFYQTIQTSQQCIGQTSSEIVGDLPLNYRENLGNIIARLIPGGSISGAPKQKTIEIIKNVESSERGYFTGIAGYFDGHNLDSCVLIRFITNDFLFKSGGGITNQSILLDEYNEIIQKVYVPIY